MKRPTFIAAFTLSLVARNNAQCVTPGYLLCMPAGSQLGGVPSDSFDDSAFWSSLQTVASLPIGRRALADGLVERQNSLCCSPDPDVECLVTKEDNIPFCYNQQTTRYVFSDESFGFVNNGTYYAADGTFVDFDKGYYSSTDGSIGTFAPATATSAAAQASGTPAATQATSTGPVTNTEATQTPVGGQPATTETPSNGAIGGMGVRKAVVFSVAISFALLCL